MTVLTVCSIKFRFLNLQSTSSVQDKPRSLNWAKLRETYALLCHMFESTTRLNDYNANEFKRCVLSVWDIVSVTMVQKLQWAPHCRGFTITLRHMTMGRTPLDEWPARRRDLYLTTNNTHKRQISMARRDSNSQSQQASDRRPTP